MLVLSRKPKQQIIIDNHTVVTVLSVRGNRVKLGVASPAEVSVRRSEVMPRAAVVAVVGTEK
ncbi:MAG: carbon storage regulator, partial [Pirellulaceae bacterium]